MLHLQAPENEHYQFIVMAVLKLYKIADINQSKEEGKDHESIQSSTTPDPGQHMGK